MVDTSYRVIARGKTGFDVEMTKPGGSQKIVPGFRSEHEANAWIVQAKRMIRDAGPWTPLVPRKPAGKAASDQPVTPTPAEIEQKRVQDTGGAANRRARTKAIREP